MVPRWPVRARITAQRDAASPVRRRTGHVRKVAQGFDGAENALGTLRAGIANPTVSDAERAYLQYLVTTYSEKLHAAEHLLGQLYFFLQNLPPI